MTRKLILPVFFLIGLIGLSSIANTSVAQKKNNSKNSTDIKDDNGIVLKIEIEYAVNKKGVLTNDRYVEYTITNVGTVPYTGTNVNVKNAIVFDLTTKDGKTIEKSIPFIEDLSPGKSTVIKYFIADVGPKRQCTAVKASKLDFRKS